MPYLDTSHTIMYYDVFESNFTAVPRSSQVDSLLLIHGFGGIPESDFAAQLPVFQRQFRVIAPHLHGYGRSTHRTRYNPSFYRDDANDLAKLLDALNIEKVLVLGFSDGGTVGLLLAASYPQRVSALAVMGSQPTITAQNVADIRHWLIETPLPEDWQNELAKLHGEPYWRTLPGMYVEGQEKLVIAGGVIITEEELASIRCPALIMHGIRDRIVPLGYAHAICKRIPHAQLLLFDAGHAAHLRFEKEYTTSVMEFFLHQHDRKETQ
ncbi:MAG TPA: alpha/beta hydrolase [Ktedonobacteraceae bacterium]|nr:alpha/beta hydrolase [Ktedonobacteraceae bacterium]